MIKHRSFTQKSGSSRKSIEETQERTRLEAESFANSEVTADGLLGFSESAVILPGLLTFLVCTTVWYKDKHGG